MEQKAIYEAVFPISKVFTTMKLPGNKIYIKEKWWKKIKKEIPPSTIEYPAAAAAAAAKSLQLCPIPCLFPDGKSK